MNNIKNTCVVVVLVLVADVVEIAEVVVVVGAGAVFNDDVAAVSTAWPPTVLSSLGVPISVVGRLFGGDAGPLAAVTSKQRLCCLQMLLAGFFKYTVLWVGAVSRIIALIKDVDVVGSFGTGSFMDATFWFVDTVDSSLLLSIKYQIYSLCNLITFIN